MTDYSDWVLKDEYRAAFVYGPKCTPLGSWHYLVELESVYIEEGHSLKRLKELFEPPVVWTYYVRTNIDFPTVKRRGWGFIKPGPNDTPTHRSRYGGDTIERIEK